MKVIGIIPARYASTRFPGKPLVQIGGKSMIQCVYEQALQSKLLNEVVIATDDERIVQHVVAFGGQVCMTSPYHLSGTDRCAEVVAQYDCDVVINIQGDEPFIHPEQIDLVIAPFVKNEHIQITTLAKKIEQPEDLFNSNVVKVVFNKKQKAMYFSRSTIPFVRGIESAQWLQQGDFYKHIGLYGFRKNTLLEVAKMEKSRLEGLESLEQLRWLEADYSIFVNITKLETVGIDTPEDLAKISDTFEVSDT